VPSRGPSSVLPRLLSLTLLCVPGCDEFQAAVEEAVADEPAPVIEPAPDPEAASAVQHSPEAIEASKVALYAECWLRTAGKVAASETKWRETVGEDGTPKKRKVPAALDAIDVHDGACLRLDESGPKRDPVLPELEGALSTYVDALRQVGLHSTALAEYYDSAAYDEDEWARGKELAPKLSGAFGRFAGAQQQLAAQILGRQSALDQALRDQAAARDGEGLRFHIHSATIAGRSWIECVRRAASSSEEVATQRQALVDCDPALTELVATAAGLDAQRRADPDRAEAIFWLTAYAHDVQQLRAAAEALHAGPPQPTGKKRKRKKTEPPLDLTRSEAAWHSVALDYAQLRFGAS